MDHHGGIQQEQEGTNPTKKKLSGSLAVALIVALVFAGIAALLSFFNYLNEQLFFERQTHLLEITDKVSEVIDITIESAWGDVQTCQKLFLDRGSMSADSVTDELNRITEYISHENPVVLAFDQKAAYYTSDGQKGHWSSPSDFLDTAPSQQVVMSGLPYRDTSQVYMVFIQRLESPVFVEDSESEITHIALALEIDALKDTFAVQGFGDSCYTFIVNAQGRRLYKNTNLQEFIDGYNILTAMENYEFINGGDIQDLKGAVGSERKACLEFRYENANYYVGTAQIPSVNWEVMLFVPTEVLGANTNALLNRTIQYFFMIFGVVILLLMAALFVVLTSRTDKKLMQQQQEANLLLSKAVKDAEDANLAKSEFLSRMSHDIRTPINGIMGMTDIAIKHIEDTDRATDCLVKIDTASRHLLSLVNDVLDMSSIESGKTVLSRNSININEVINNCTSIITGQLLNRKLEFTSEFGEFSHPNLIGDELRLQQIFINILGNAIKFTSDEGKVHFHGEEIPADSDKKAKFRFVIEDTGKGMSEKFLKHIFEPFSQEEGFDRKTYEGTGLGMAITKQFVDLMEGEIKVESRLNQGSRFTLELSFDINQEAEGEKLVLSNESDLAGLKVLLVEDNKLNQEIAKYILEEGKMLVTVAQNGREAVEAFAANPPGTFDVILMDIRMPVMDGMTASKEIRELEREDATAIPIIAMTANAYEEDRQKTREAGMNEHLSKPINKGVLMQTLARYGRKDESDTH